MRRSRKEKEKET